MKKAIIIVAFVLLVMPLTGFAEEKKPAINGGSLIVIMPRVTEDNFNVKVEGNLVTVNWLTSQFMTTGLIVESGYKVNRYDNMEGRLYTYHTAVVRLVPGKDYKITPVSIYNGQEFKGKTVTISL